MRAFSKAAATLFLIVYLSPAEGLSGAPASYKTTEIAGRIDKAEGPAAWSSDGYGFAFLNDGISVYDIPGGKRKKLDIEGSYFLSWAPGDKIVVLCKEEDRYRLVVVKPGDYATRKFDLPFAADYAYGISGRKEVVILSSSTKKIGIGKDVSYRLSVLDTESGSLKDVFFTSTILPLKSPENLGGWINAGLNPMDTTVLLNEYIDPPALLPHVNIKSVDYFTGEVKDVIRKYPDVLSTSGSWSPDGGRIALTGPNGFMKIIDMQNGEIHSRAARGAKPSWNPRGSRIFIGGSIYPPDNDIKIESILDKDAALYWSPAGDKAVFISDRKLWLIEGFKPEYQSGERPFNEEAREKLLLLKELYRDGFIDEKEYNGRAKKILNIKE